MRSSKIKKEYLFLIDPEEKPYRDERVINSWYFPMPKAAASKVLICCKLCNAEGDVALTIGFAFIALAPPRGPKF